MLTYLRPVTPTGMKGCHCFQSNGAAGPFLSTIKMLTWWGRRSWCWSGSHCAHGVGAVTRCAGSPGQCRRIQQPRLPAEPVTGSARLALSGSDRDCNAQRICNLQSSCSWKSATCQAYLQIFYFVKPTCRYYSSSKTKAESFVHIIVLEKQMLRYKW